MSDIADKAERSAKFYRDARAICQAGSRFPQDFAQTCHDTTLPADTIALVDRCRRLEEFAGLIWDEETYRYLAKQRHDTHAASACQRLCELAEQLGLNSGNATTGD